MKLNRIIIPIIIAILVFPIVSFASVTNGTISSVNKYAWSNQTGWINFKTVNGNIKISDSGITGYVWNSNYGWINMSPTNDGVKVATNGSLSGYAWGTNIGWIDFSGVSINSSGRFVGTATGKIIGTLTFDCPNCNVSTDYVPKDFRSIQTSTTASSNGYTGTISPVTASLTTIATSTNTTTVKSQAQLHSYGGINKISPKNNTSEGVKSKVLSNQFFDIHFSLNKSSVTKSENIISRVTFVNFGKVSTLVNMLFSITDKNGNVLWKKEATTTVYTGGVYTKRLPLLNLTIGNYTLRLHTKYNKIVEDNFSAPFQIISEAKTFNWLPWSIGILILLILLVFVIKIIHNKMVSDIRM